MSQQIVCDSASAPAERNPHFHRFSFPRPVFSSAPPDRQKLMRQSDLEVPHISNRGELISRVAARFFLFFSLACVWVSFVG